MKQKCNDVLQFYINKMQKKKMIIVYVFLLCYFTQTKVIAKGMEDVDMVSLKKKILVTVKRLIEDVKDMEFDYMQKQYFTLRQRKDLKNKVSSLSLSLKKYDWLEKPVRENIVSAQSAGRRVLEKIALKEQMKKLQNKQKTLIQLTPIENQRRNRNDRNDRENREDRENMNRGGSLLQNMNQRSERSSSQLRQAMKEKNSNGENKSGNNRNENSNQAQNDLIRSHNNRIHPQGARLHTLLNGISLKA